jgi:hypothetical protein
MSNYFGTSGDDVLDQTSLGLEDWSNIYGEAGDDTITIKVGRAEGGAGNDKITGLSTASNVLYGSSPRGVVVNLATGIAQDGFGTTDTIINIRVVHGTRFSDNFTGSLANEEFWGQGGSDTFVGGGGSDTVTYWSIKPTEVQITYDKVADTLTVKKNTSWGDHGIDLLTGIQTINFRGPNNYQETFNKYDLITDLPKVSSSTFVLSKDAYVSQFKGGDFNGDGNMDVLVVEQIGTGTAPAKSFVFLGDGKETFVESSSLVFSTSSMEKVKSVVGGGRTLVADFNKDGITDFFQLNFGNDAPPFPGGNNQLFLSSLTSRKIEDVSNTLQQTTQLNHGGSIGDVNGDGYLDILVNSLKDGNFLQLNDGTGHFLDRSDLIPHPMIATSSNNIKVTNTSSGIIDVNVDGQADIVLGRWNDVFLTIKSQVLLNDGIANFNKIVPVDLPLSGVDREIILDVKAINLNGDTLPDLMLAVTNGGETNYYKTPYIQLLINDGNGHFHDETSTRLPQSLVGSTHWIMSLSSVDFNHDGQSDILATSAGVSVSSTAYLNRGDGTFSKYWESGLGGKSIAMDVNNDGMSDIVTAYGSSIVVNQNNLPNNHIYKANFGGDSLLGSSSADKFYNGQGNDILNGSGGVDTLISPSSRSNYLVTKSSTGFTLKESSGIYGTDSVINFERLQFSNGALALDINGNAGTIVKILGAVAGKQSLANKEYVGVGLDLLDKGMSYSELGALALKAVGLTTSDQIVTTLWTNIVGSAPSAAEKAPFIEMLENGFSRGEFVKLAAETPLNSTNIDLVGLAQTGIEYLPIV